MELSGSEMSKEDEVNAINAFLDNYPPVLTVHQLAEILGRKVPTAYKWLQAGEIPGSLIAGSWVIYRDAVRARLIERINRDDFPAPAPESKGKP